MEVEKAVEVEVDVEMVVLMVKVKVDVVVVVSNSVLYTCYIQLKLCPCFL